MTKTVIDNVSLKQLAHFAQVVHNAKFARFDYGSVENRKHYKSTNPPEYNLTRIEVPITVIYGSKDALVSLTVNVKILCFFNSFSKLAFLHIQDVELFISKVANVRQTLKLPWNHLDFIFGKDVDVRINDFIIRGMKKEALIERNPQLAKDMCARNNETEAIDACRK